MENEMRLQVPLRNVAGEMRREDKERLEAGLRVPGRLYMVKTEKGTKAVFMSYNIHTPRVPALYRTMTDDDGYRSAVIVRGDRLKTLTSAPLAGLDFESFHKMMDGISAIVSQWFDDK